MDGMQDKEMHATNVCTYLFELNLAVNYSFADSEKNTHDWGTEPLVTRLLHLGFRRVLKFRVRV